MCWNLASINNAVCKLGTRVIRQVKGTPQGDSLYHQLCALAHWDGVKIVDEKTVGENKKEH